MIYRFSYFSAGFAKSISLILIPEAFFIVLQICAASTEKERNNYGHHLISRTFKFLRTVAVVVQYLLSYLACAAGA